MNRLELIAMTGGFLVGCGIGWMMTEAIAEKRAREKYEESARIRDNAIQIAASMGVNKKPVPIEVETDGAVDIKIQMPNGEVVTAGQTLKMAPDFTIDPAALDTKNDYHKAMAAVETPHEVFVSGGVNDYGVSYIDEEEYYDENGNVKEQIAILIDDHNPRFMMSGIEISDWDVRVGASILVDFYKLTVPGKDRVLYVRNHRTGEDYEVIQEIP